MRVEVELRGGLATRATALLPTGRGPVELGEGSSVGVLAIALGLRPAMAVFVVNGAAATARHVLRDGDRVQAFPMAAGG